MNCVDYAIQRVMNSDIDDYILRLAFTQVNGNFSSNWYDVVNGGTVESNIRDKVIHRMVLPACNVNGGTTEIIDLTGSNIRDLGGTMIQINVPTSLTGGRLITSVNEVYLGALQSNPGVSLGGIGANAPCGVGVLNEALTSLVGSLGSSKSFGTTYTNIQMLGNNVFAVMGLSSTTYMLSAKVILEYDKGLSTISPRHYEYFAELVELAVKAYIYRTCRRPAAEAVMRSGVPLQDITDTIADYRDAWTQYKEYLRDTWTKCMAYSNRSQVTMDITASIPRRL